MDRLACVDVPALPLQLLLRDHAGWRGRPVAVVDEDRPQGLITWVNEAAFRLGIRAGQRYAEGLALAADLRAGVVSPDAVTAEVDALTEALRTCTPHVEPYADEAGVFWLDASGLGRLYPSLAVWAEAVRRVAARARLRAVVVVGFRRFATFAVAKAAAARVTVFDDAEAEAAAAARVELARVGLDHDACEALAKLAVRTVGGFLRLPAAGIARRFGERAVRLRRLAAGELWDPLQARAPVVPLEGALDLDDPETDVHSLVFCFKRLLDPLLDRLAAQGEALEELTFRLDAREEERLRPALPTLDGGQLLALVRLRLEATAFEAGVRRLLLTARGVKSSSEQLELFAAKTRRDPEAAGRAFARLRAMFGAEAVVRARLRDAHLPEAIAAWEPLAELPAARAAPAGETWQMSQISIVRRVFARPAPYPAAAEKAAAVKGPYVVSGGWWHREIRRDYHFVETESGAWLWMYHDRRRGRWFVQGRLA